MFESKRNAIIFMVIAFVFALIAGILFMNYFKAVNVQMGEMTTYYVATKDIAPRTPLKAGDFKPVVMPKRYVPVNLVTDFKSFEGAVTVVSLAKGDALENNVLKPVAVSVNGADSRLVQLVVSKQIQIETSLEPLDRVDLIVSYNKTKDTPVTEVFMRDVLVSTVYMGNPKDAGAGVQKDTSAQLLGIGVDVTLENARSIIEKINYASSIHILKANIVEKAKPVAAPEVVAPAPAVAAPAAVVAP